LKAYSNKQITPIVTPTCYHLRATIEKWKFIGNSSGKSKQQQQRHFERARADTVNQLRRRWPQLMQQQLEF
jgi:hypothetical protein